MTEFSHKDNILFESARATSLLSNMVWRSSLGWISNMLTKWTDKVLPTLLAGFLLNGFHSNCHLLTPISSSTVSVPMSVCFVRLAIVRRYWYLLISPSRSAVCCHKISSSCSNFLQRRAVSCPVSTVQPAKTFFALLTTFCLIFQLSAIATLCLLQLAVCCGVSYNVLSNFSALTSWSRKWKGNSRLAVFRFLGRLCDQLVHCTAV